MKFTQDTLDSFLNFLGNKLGYSGEDLLDYLNEKRLITAEEQAANDLQEAVSFVRDIVIDNFNMSLSNYETEEQRNKYVKEFKEKLYSYNFREEITFYLDRIIDRYLDEFQQQSLDNLGDSKYDFIIDEIDDTLSYYFEDN